MRSDFNTKMPYVEEDDQKLVNAGSEQMKERVISLWMAVCAIIIDADGKFVTDDCPQGFDEKVIQQIREYLHPPEKQQQIPEKPPMENYQKYFENGEYLRSAETDEEQNYNMIDGRVNNQKKKPKISDPKKRPSVLKRLYQKQDELERRYGKKTPEVNMERNRK